MRLPPNVAGRSNSEIPVPSTSFIELSFELRDLNAEAAEEACFECGAASVTYSDLRDDPVLEPAPGTTPLWPTVKLRALFDAATDRAAVHAALHPRREVWVGWNTVKAIIGQRFIPGLQDRHLAKVAWEGQTTRALPPGHPIEHPEDNVDAPLAGDSGAHGPFDHIAKMSSKTFWLRSNMNALFGGALALGTLLALRRWGTARR